VRENRVGAHPICCFERYVRSSNVFLGQLWQRLSAVRVFVEGFCERSGLKVDLDLPERSIRMPKDFETTIFRVVQEGLTNVHKHSRSPTAKVQVKFEGLRIAVLVEDQG
jgi:signal transduction histidine kinase